MTAPYVPPDDMDALKRHLLSTPADATAVSKPAGAPVNPGQHDNAARAALIALLTAADKDDSIMAARSSPASVRLPAINSTIHDEDAAREQMFSHGDVRNQQNSRIHNAFGPNAKVDLGVDLPIGEEERKPRPR